jgi:hypothetical protein
MATRSRWDHLAPSALHSAYPHERNKGSFSPAGAGALVGSAKLFQSRDYERYERAVDRDEPLVTVSGPTELLERARHKETGEAI